MLAKAVLVGRIVRDPDLRYSPEGKPWAAFTVAVERPGNGEEKSTDFFDCVCFGKSAEAVAEWALKGSLVAVDGRLQIATWERDGQRQQKPQIVASDVRFLALKKREGAQQKGETAPAPEEAPAW